MQNDGSAPSPSETTEKVLRYGLALASALRSFDVLESHAGWFERPVLRLLRTTYRQRLRHLVEVLPGDIADQILKK